MNNFPFLFQLNIPFPSQKEAQFVLKTIEVDEELAKSVKRIIQQKESNLIFELTSNSIKDLRTTIQSLINSILLTLRTLHSFEILI
ncbi:hypothetical protein M0811_08302 [Anaeramoeba ignava]|uniref:Transcription factor Pcc1 n=1 Tax=Anaeramoeba ignava TaxID=1746090 RepID=A0A9Q0RBP0_ANAIG|nr:hypothetical protein M0811_08302 [Anaeramoeba ignava]